MTFATKINAQVAATNIEFPLSDNDGQTHLMMSAGIAEFSSTSIINIKDIIEQAQYALKTANRLGANQIQIFAQNVVSSDQLSNKTADNSEEFGEEFVEDNETTNVTSIGQLKTV
jgi:hypothetical protein